MTDRKNFEALLDEYERALTAEDADDKIGAVRCVRARAAVLAAYDAARTTADYWKAEHVAANVEIERLKNAGREGRPVAWMVEHHQDKKPNVSVICVGGPYENPEAKAQFIAKMYGGTVTPLFTHPAPKADAEWVLVPREPTEAMLRAGHAAYMHGEGGEGGHGGYELDRQLYRAMIEAAERQETGR